MTNKEYWLQEIKMTSDQLDRAYKFYQDNAVCKDEKETIPMNTFTIEYQFSTIGTAKIMNVNDKTFWIDEEESNP